MVVNLVGAKTNKGNALGVFNGQKNRCLKTLI